ncbi:MAG: phosphate acyltransferase [Candidatus Omnitrophota bacterium]|nr:phosphate acyltransferase [Candidatus Omnitrophota bacterium]
MDTITKIHQKAKAKLKTIVLPEYEDSRVVEAARIIEQEGMARVLLLTPDKINPADKERYIDEFYQFRKTKESDVNVIRKIFDEPLYYAAMMTRDGMADGFVSGASHTTPDVARAAIWCLGVDEHISIVTSAFIMVVPNCPLGEEGTFLFADCGIIPDPNPRQLACIALASAELARKVLDLNPRVALLSYSTKGSAKGKSVEKIGEAKELLKEIAPNLLVDGEMQVDAAIVPEVAKIKSPDSPVGGRANVLIFPNLEAGNISYKLVQRLANARALGPLLLGLNKPCSDLSRGCSVEDIVDCVAITAIRAQ